MTDVSSSTVRRNKPAAWQRFLPFLAWLPHYPKSYLRGDLTAGLTVGVMLVPQGMAYAMLAGMPPIYGLYAATVPLVLYALLGTSRQLAVGPVAMVSLLTATGVSTMAEVGSPEYIGLVLALAFIVGAFQLALGVFRLGFMVNFLSHPVISGFTSAAAIVIALSQLKHLLGIPMPRSEHVHEILVAAAQNIGKTHGLTLSIGLGAIVLIQLFKKWRPAFPGALVVVALSIVAVGGLGLSEYGVKIVGEVPSGLPALSMPLLDWPSVQKLVPIALAIALVGFMESIAVAKAMQARHRDYALDANQELIALGMANIGGSFFSSFPVTGGFSRTAVNDQAGARTGLASLISAALIVVTLLFLTPLFYYLPNAVLAAVIIVAVYGLIDHKEARHLWHSNRGDFALWAVTFVATLFVGIEQGIALGVILSLALVIYRTTKPHIAVLGRVPGTFFYRNVERFSNLEQRPDVLIVRFDADLYFANVNYFLDTLDTLAAQRGSALRVLVINAESISNLDSSGAHAIEELLRRFRQQGVSVFFVSVKGPVRDAMARAGLIEKIGPENFFLSNQQAVDACDQVCTGNEDELAQYALQTNAAR
ncbi:MAG: solute carrier family 26 protein [Saprospiraceae bacterium]|nr:solute carrier family 26 protein [Saprospiraceae bacterium]MDW8229034.1 solute carrier family 26 protein [Saprospiraceae bacterium]